MIFQNTFHRVSSSSGGMAHAVSNQEGSSSIPARASSAPTGWTGIRMYYIVSD